MCVKCNENKPVANFYFSKDGVIYRRCKSCEAERCKEYKARTSYSPSEKRAENRTASKAAEARECSTCGEMKPKTDFEKRRNQCTLCRQEYIKAYHAQEHVKQRVNEYMRLQKHNDPHALIKARLRARLYNLCKKFSVEKQIPTEELFGCSWAELKVHLEKQFAEGMHWNHPKLSIDHKIPCDIFDLTSLDEQRRCFHYTNLQPMWLKDNIRKSNKFEDEYAELYANLKSMYV